MRLSSFKQKWAAFVARMNEFGVPLPMVRDPKSGLASVSLTLVFISFNVVLIGLVGKWAGALGGVDITQALNLFYACAALYWSRKFQRGDASISDVDSQVKDPSDKTEHPQRDQAAVKPDNPDA